MLFRSHNWCQECHQCQSSKGPPARPHGRLQKVITGEPLDIVAIDILSGLPLATDGSKHILVATDYFTKWSEAYPLPDAEAHTCMTALYNNFFSRFGPRDKFIRIRAKILKANSLPNSATSLASTKHIQLHFTLDPMAKQNV